MTASACGLVSAVIPCYNQARFLTDAVGSVLDQSYPSIEVIVVDDGSVEDVRAALESFPTVRYLRQRNAGVSAARNSGFAASRGEFVLFLDADDRLTPGALCAQTRALHSSPDALAAAGLCALIDAGGKRMPFEQERAFRGDAYYWLLHRNFIWTPAQVLYQRRTLEAIGGFDPSVNACADYDLYLRMTRVGSLAWHRAIVAEYRQHGENMSGNPRLMLPAVLTVLDRQTSWVRGRPAYRAAQARGREFWRGYYGDRLVDDIRTGVRTRTVRLAAVAGLFTLLRHYPEAVVGNLVRKLKVLLSHRVRKA